MAAQQGVKETVLMVPVDIAKTSLGFAIDGGGSVIKLLYRSKEDEGKVDNNFMPIRCRYFPTKQSAELIAFLQENCVVRETTASDPADWPKVYHTGVTTQHFGKDLDKLFKCKTKLLPEPDMAIDGLTKMVPCLQRPYYATSVSAVQSAVSYSLQLIAMFKAMMPPEPAEMSEMEAAMAAARGQHISRLTGVTASEWAKEFDTLPEETFPCIVVNAGSAWPVLEIDKTHQQKTLEFNINGGRTFLGLARKLLKVENFDQIIEMASKGSAKKVDITIKDMQTEDVQHEGWYADYPPDGDLFALGKLGDPAYDGKYTDNDLAAGLVELYIRKLAQTGCTAARLCDRTTVLYSGSFLNTEYVRESLQKHFYSMSFFEPITGHKLKTMHIVNEPGFLCVMGVWYNNCKPAQ